MATTFIQGTNWQYYRLCNKLFKPLLNENKLLVVYTEKDCIRGPGTCKMAKVCQNLGTKTLECRKSQ